LRDDWATTTAKDGVVTVSYHDLQKQFVLHECKWHFGRLWEAVPCGKGSMIVSMFPVIIITFPRNRPKLSLVPVDACVSVAVGFTEESRAIWIAFLKLALPSGYQHH
jgi:hypothetical protein